MRSIEEKIAIGFVFCSTVEVEIRFGHVGRAQSLLRKIHSSFKSLAAHVDNPAHVPDKRLPEFRTQLAQLRRRIAALDSQVKEG